MNDRRDGTFPRPFVRGVTLVCLCLSAGWADTVRPPHFGRDWVRSHPFTISALLLEDTGFEHYQDLGMNTALIWKGREGLFEKSVARGMPWHYMGLRNLKKTQGGYDTAPSKEYLEGAKAFYDAYPGGQGFVIWDEPRHPAFPIMAEAMQWYRETFPEALAYSNLYSAGAPSGKYYDSRDADGQYIDPPVPYGYADYIQEFIDTCRPDILSTDIYPFVQYETCDDETYIHTRYFDTLEGIREKALEAGIPYWCFIQAYEYRDRYLPSESDLRMQVYSSLAYGFTGISYFIYYAPHYGRGVLGVDAEPSPIGEDIRAVNTEVERLGAALRFLTSTDVRYIPAIHYDAGDHVPNAVPIGAPAFDADAGKPYGIADIGANGISRGRNGLIGFFTDDDGGRYFMLVNLRRARGVPAADLSMGMTVTFDPSVETVYRLSRTTGDAEEVAIGGGMLDVKLPGGTGDLFKINDGVFPR